MRLCALQNSLGPGSRHLQAASLPARRVGVCQRLHTGRRCCRALLLDLLALERTSLPGHLPQDHRSHLDMGRCHYSALDGRLPAEPHRPNGCQLSLFAAFFPFLCRCVHFKTRQAALFALVARTRLSVLFDYVAAL